jgi:hypothetical protein
MIGDTKIKKAIIATLLTILMASVAYAIVVWTYQTKITVSEPFTITTDLQTEVSLYPGTYNYTINITNNAMQPYSARLNYTITAINCSIQITPSSGSTYPIGQKTTITIAVNVTVTLLEGFQTGTATIDWQIERL